MNDCRFIVVTELLRIAEKVIATVYVIDEMTLEDVDEVSKVEERCFATPWPVSAYRRELRHRRQNYYVVLRDEPNGVHEITTAPRSAPSEDHESGRFPFLPFLRRTGSRQRAPILGFAGMWAMLDEAHITTIGVDPDHQGKGLGEYLFVSLLDEAIQRRATWVTLEVRVSNQPAQELYRKYGFTVQGRRPRYYSDNNEDAFIMWSESFRDPEYRRHIEQLRQRVMRRLASSVEVDLSS